MYWFIFGTVKKKITAVWRHL